jgi:hypothetical protein
MNETDPQDAARPPAERPVRELTVARVRERPGADHVEVAFYESARFYRLPKTHPGFEEAVALLRAAQQDGRPVAVAFSSPQGDLIEKVLEGGAPT